MTRIPVIAVFDIGKTNKKLLLFDERYQIVGEQAVQLNETVDEDGDSCEDIALLSDWINNAFRIVRTSREFDLKALNVATYGASFIHLDENEKLLTPLYDYKKPYPVELSNKFYQTYGGEETLSLQTASPVLGSLNSGMQLYRLKQERPILFTRVKYSLHLPQYVTWLMTGQACSDITSIGCHTVLWDFAKRRYHDWVFAEGISAKLPPVFSSKDVLPVKSKNQSVAVGVGLHDSSAALIPYLAHFKEPFILLSTGTWSISLNPFNHAPLTAEELTRDCLCYLDYDGNPVKASRLFAGNEHELHAKRLAEHFHVEPDYYKEIIYNPVMITTIRHNSRDSGNLSDNRNLSQYKTYEEAYHQLIDDLVSQQLISTRLVMNKNSGVKHIFVDGGFGRNTVFMNLLALAFGDMEVFASSVPHATALGAAVTLHSHWNKNPLPEDIIKLKRYCPRQL